MRTKVPPDTLLATPKYMAASFSATNEIIYVNREAIKPFSGAEYVIIDLLNISSPWEDEINEMVREKGSLDNYELIWNKGPLYLFKSAD